MPVIAKKKELQKNCVALKLSQVVNSDYLCTRLNLL